MFQNERNEIISAFKKQEFPILVATDVAARGLDIAHVRNVIKVCELIKADGEMLQNH